MPLLMLTGLPCSGKTTRAKEIAKALSEAGSSVMVINEEEMLLRRAEVYKDSEAEKKHRGAIKAAVERHMSKQMVVIADSLNYIKGFRYELYCIARAAETPTCVVYCDTPEEVCAEWNASRQDDAYPSDSLQGLLRRYECPDARSRWDSPLFTVAPEDPTPQQAILDALLRRNAPRANLATKPVQVADTNYVYELEEATNVIVKAISDHQLSVGQVAGDAVAVPGTATKVQLVQNVSLVQLRAIRRQFLKIAQLKPPSGVAAISAMFVDYLNNNLTPTP